MLSFFRSTRLVNIGEYRAEPARRRPYFATAGHEEKRVGHVAAYRRKKPRWAKGFEDRRVARVSENISGGQPRGRSLNETGTRCRETSAASNEKSVENWCRRQSSCCVCGVAAVPIDLAAPLGERLRRRRSAVVGPQSSAEPIDRALNRG